MWDISGVSGNIRSLGAPVQLLKITLVKFTYPGQRSKIPFLSHNLVNELQTFSVVWRHTSKGYKIKSVSYSGPKKRGGDKECTHCDWLGVDHFLQPQLGPRKKSYFTLRLTQRPKPLYVKKLLKKKINFVPNIRCKTCVSVSFVDRGTGVWLRRKRQMTVVICLA